MSEHESTRPDPRAWEGWPTPSGIPDSGQLGLLAADAAARAADLLAGSAAEAGDPLVDAIRLLSTPAGAQQVAQASRLTGLPEEDLRRLVLAYRHGGSGGVAAALAAAPCDADELAAAVDEVRRRRTFTIDDLSTEPGQITDAGAGVRLRRGPDGRWYPFTLARTHWWPAAGANPSAAVAYQAAVRARSLRRAGA
jgi:hypothetical protein